MTTRFPPAVRRYVLLHFLLLGAFGTWLLLLAKVSTAFAAASSAAIVVGLGSLGGLLDGRDRALRHERWRLVGTGALGLVLAIGARAPGVGAVLVALALLGLAQTRGAAAMVPEP